MISDQRIRELIAIGNENRNLDYKGPFSWTAAEKDEQIAIVKDVLAFANTRDGGLILVGINDKTGALDGLTDEQSSSFEQTRFNDFVQEYTEPKHSCFIYHRQIDGKKIVAIEIPEFSDIPILCKRTVQSTTNPKKILLRKAGLYKRTDKATSELVEDASEMRELLNRGLLRRQDELLTAMNRILRPNSESQSVESESQFSTEMQDAINFLEGIADSKLRELPHWVVALRPTSYSKKRIPELGELQRLVRASAVSLRGWNFPHINEGYVTNFSDGFQAVTDWKDSPFGRHVEGFRAYRSGLFVWGSDLWEENASEYRNRSVLSFLGVIYGVTEWMTFAQRYYEAFLPIEAAIRVEMTLTGTMNRSLIATYPAVPMPLDFTARIDTVSANEQVEMTELRSDTQGVARKLIKDIFELFNWNNPREDVLQGWQRELIEKRV